MGRVVSGCLFQGYPVIFKIKIPFVPRVFEKDSRSWREFDELSEKEKKKDSSIFKCMDILIHYTYKLCGLGCLILGGFFFLMII